MMFVVVLLLIGSFSCSYKVDGGSDKFDVGFKGKVNVNYKR